MNYQVPRLVNGKVLDEVLPERARLMGSTVALLGDSFVVQCAPPGGFGPTAGAQWYAGNDWWSWADILLGKRTARAGTFGVGGHTTGQIRARVSAVLALDPRPAYCVVQGGTNDLATGVLSATTIANQEAICEELLAAGITPILVSVPPVPYVTAPALLALSEILAWQKSYATAARGVIYCDWRKYVTKPDGTWRAGLSDDALHPNSAGCFLLGKALAETLEARIPKVDTLTTVNNDPKLINENPMMTGATGVLGAGVTGAAPDFWYIEAWVGDTLTTATSSVEEDAATGERSWKVALTGGSVQLRRQLAAGSRWAVGDRVYAEVELEVDSSQPFSGIDKINLQIDAVSGASATAQDPNAPSSDAANHPAGIMPFRGVFRTPVLTVPTGTTAMAVKVIVRRVAGATPAITFRVRRFAWRRA